MPSWNSEGRSYHMLSRLVSGGGLTDGKASCLTEAKREARNLVSPRKIKLNASPFNDPTIVNVPSIV